MSSVGFVSLSACETVCLDVDTLTSVKRTKDSLNSEVDELINKFQNKFKEIRSNFKVKFLLVITIEVYKSIHLLEDIRAF